MHTLHNDSDGMERRLSKRKRHGWNQAQEIYVGDDCYVKLKDRGWEKRTSKVGFGV